MILVKWLTGEFESVEAPITVSKLKSDIRTRYDRNQVVQIFSVEESKEEDVPSSLPDDYLIEEGTQVNVIVFPEKEMRPSESEQVAKLFRAHCDQVSSQLFDVFRGAVKDAHAVVAGGSVLSALIDKPINDLDVYVHYSYAFQLIMRLMNDCKFSTKSWKIHTGSMYDESFFRRNQILLRVPLYKPFRRGRRDHRVQFGNQPLSEDFQIDIIVIPDEVNLEDVVTNFDLTFCETWWDGDKVYASDPDGIRFREGKLKPAYWKCFFQDLNWFTIRRLRKYRSRGLRVNLCDNPEMTLNQLATEVLDNQTDQNVEDWAVRKFYSGALSLFQRGRHELIGRQEIAFFFVCFPNRARLTYLSLQEKWSGREDLLRKVVMKVFSEQWEEVRNMAEKYRKAYLSTFQLTENMYVSPDENERAKRIWNHAEWQSFWTESMSVMIDNNNSQPRESETIYLGRFDSDEENDFLVEPVQEIRLFGDER